MSREWGSVERGTVDAGETGRIRSSAVGSLAVVGGCTERGRRGVARGSCSAEGIAEGTAEPSVASRDWNYKDLRSSVGRAGSPLFPS